MNYELINETIGLMDFDLIEAADEAPQSAGAVRVTPFVKRPWLKWAAAAVAIVVIAGGTPLALKAIGSFRNENFVSPNGSGNGNSGVVTPIDSSESESGEQESSSEPESSGSLPDGSEKPVADSDSHSRGGGNVSSGGEHSAPDETPDKPDDTQTPPAEEPEVVIEGDFLKDNMPAVTYRIAGESRTFVYQKSSVVKTSESGDGKLTYSVVDRYADPDGATLSVNADTGDLIRYESGSDYEYVDFVLSEEELIDAAIRVAATSDIPLTGFENANSSVWSSENRYYVSLTVVEGIAEVCFNKSGELLYLGVKDNAMMRWF